GLMLALLATASSPALAGRIGSEPEGGHGLVDLGVERVREGGLGGRFRCCGAGRSGGGVGAVGGSAGRSGGGVGLRVHGVVAEERVARGGEEAGKLRARRASRANGGMSVPRSAPRRGLGTDAAGRPGSPVKGDGIWRI